MPSIHRYAIGTAIRFTIFDDTTILDVSSASTKDLKLIKPDGTQLTKTLVFSTKSGDTGDGKDGRVEYIIISGDVDQNGTYQWQLHLIIGTWDEHSDDGTFTVLSNLF